MLVKKHCNKMFCSRELRGTHRHAQQAYWYETKEKGNCTFTTLYLSKELIKQFKQHSKQSCFGYEGNAMFISQLSVLHVTMNGYDKCAKNSVSCIASGGRGLVHRMLKPPRKGNSVFATLHSSKELTRQSSLRRWKKHGHTVHWG